MSGFDIDPDNRDSIFGCGLVRQLPGHFVGLYRTALAASLDTLQAIMQC